MSKRDKRFDTLEEAEDALKESSDAVSKAKKEKEIKDTNKKDAPPDDEAKRRFVIIGCIVIAVLIIIAIAVNVMRKNAEAKAAAESESASIAAEEEAASIAAEEASQAESESAFSECDISEINTLINDYFSARLSVDTSKIYKLFGRTDTTANDTFAKKLKSQASWIQGFNDIKVYAADGTSDNEKFCLVTYVIDFRRTDAMAPGIMYFFVQSNDDGSYIIEEALAKDKLDYADKLMNTSFASELIKSTDDELKASLDSNSTLSLIYTSFQDGEIYKESDLDVDADQDVNLFMDPEDSVLVDDDTLKNIEQESAEQASIEASEGAADVYETAADTESETIEESAVETAATSETNVQ